MASSIAVVCSDPERWGRLSGIVSGCGFSPVRCDTLASFTQLFAQHHFASALCEERLPDCDYRELIARLRQAGQSLPVIVVSRFDDWGSYLEAMVAGAFDYVGYPPYPREVERAVEAAVAESLAREKAAKAAA